jgi:RNA polymerase sigma-70 factor (ECF subfamily)
VIALALTFNDAVAVRNEQFVVHYTEVHERAWRFAQYLCGRREDAEDLLAETVAHAIRGFDRLRDASRFPWWFLRLMRNLHIDHCRARKRQLDAADFGGDVLVWERLDRYPAIPGPQRSLEARAVFRALDRLPEGLRLPLALHTLEGYSMEEIGSVMGLKPGAVKVRVHRARAKLAEMLGDGFEVEG